MVNIFLSFCDHNKQKDLIKLNIKKQNRFSNALITKNIKQHQKQIQTIEIIKFQFDTVEVVGLNPIAPTTDDKGL